MTAAGPASAARPALVARPFHWLAGLSFGGVALALVSQHAYAMEPCAWCVLQRLLFLGIGVVALLGIAWRGKVGALVAAGLAMLLADAGIAAAVWQHFVAAQSSSCGFTFAERFMLETGLPGLLPSVFEARASCAEAAVDLFGVPYAGWSAALFAACGALAALAIVAALRRR